MKKFFFLFLLSLSNVTFAASDVIVDAVTCKTFEGEGFKTHFCSNSLVIIRRLTLLNLNRKTL